ncbi:hypothetical protein [Marinobacter sp.]|uniref:hypothetical protein n=1 Tax=Marinobacter sp. TaxID=50741 RepID=UPI003562DAAD
MVKYSTLSILLSLSISNHLYALEVIPTNEPNTFSLSGEGFGEAPTIALHADFEEGPIGGSLASPWTLQSSGGPLPTYTDDRQVTGKLAAKATFTGNYYNSTAEYKSLPKMRQIYVSYYVYVDHVAGDKSRNVKLARITSGYSSGGYDQPSLGITLFDNNNNGVIYMYPGESKENYDDWMGTLTGKGWKRIEYFVRLSEPSSTNNGLIQVKIDGNIEMNFSNIITDYYGNSFEWLSMPYYVAHDPGGDYFMYYDNVYVSDNYARVEICSTQTYQDCTNPVISKIESWNTNNVVFSTTDEETYSKYVYVFLANGSLLNTNGLSVCTDCPEPPIVEVQ